MKCMVMFQYSTCDMHFGIVKFNGLCQNSFKKLPIEYFCLILPSVKSAYSAINKDSDRTALKVFHEIENNFRGNLKPCR